MKSCQFSGLQQLVVAPLHYVQEKLSTLESTEAPKEDASDREHEEDEGLSTAPYKNGEAVADDSMQNHITPVRSHFSFRTPIDPVHEEAFSILKKLQVLQNFELWPTMIY